MDAVRTANDVLAFLLELAAIAALATWGFTVGPGLVARIALGVGTPALLIVGWAIWLAPRSEHRLDLPWLVLAKIVVFGLVVAALAAAGHPALAGVLATVVAVNLGLAVLWGRA